MEHDPGIFDVRKTPKNCFAEFPAPPRARIVEHLAVDLAVAVRMTATVRCGKVCTVRCTVTLNPKPKP